MKKLKLYFVTAGLIFGGTTLGFGQENQSRDAHTSQKIHREAMKDSMVRILGLTSDQEAKIKEIKASYKVKIDGAKSNASLSDTDKSKEIKELRKKEFYEMNSVLTDVQKEKLKEYRASHKSERNHHSNKTPEERKSAYISRLDSVVSLTDDQKVKIQTTLDSFGAKKMAIVENKALSKEERDTQLKQLRKDQSITISKILDKNQRELMKEHREVKKTAKKTSTPASN